MLGGLVLLLHGIRIRTIVLGIVSRFGLYAVVTRLIGPVKVIQEEVDHDRTSRDLLIANVFTRD